MTLEQRLKERLAELDALHARLQPEPTNPSPHAPLPAWVKSVQKRNPFYNEILGSLK